MPFALLVVLRLGAAGFFLATFGYAVLNCSPFAFDMFIRPQLFPQLTAFVSWHHIWFTAAWMAATATLHGELDWRVERAGAARAAHWLAVGFAGVMGAVSLWLLASPFLPTLWNDGRALPAAVLSLLPLVWLAAIDHVSSLEAVARRVRQPLPSGRRLAATCSLSAVFVWATHVTHAASKSTAGGDAAAWLVTSLWAAGLTAAVFAVLYALHGAISGAADHTRHPWLFEYAAVVLAVGAAVAAFLNRAVFPTISLPPGASAVSATVAGLAIALTWSGLALKRHRTAERPLNVPAQVLFSPGAQPAGLGTPAWLFVLATAAVFLLDTVERLDWGFVLQRTIVLVELILVFGLVLRLTEGVREERVSRRLAWAPLLVLGAVLVFPPAVAGLAAGSGRAALTPAVAFERHGAREVAFTFFADAMVSRPGVDRDYHRYLQLHADFSGAASVTVPDVDLRTPETAVVSRPDRRPDIFVFVVDSLRRDYVSPYNPAVRFTPNIERFAAGNFVFRNAFTRHGGTELAMPSIWAGAHVVRKVRSHGFERMNALEKLINADGYRVAINDFTVAEHLRHDTPVTTIDPGIPSVDTDLCRNLESLQAHLDSTSADSRPVFGYLAPMNVHILNTRRGGQQSLDGEYPGFYAPYASRLRRIDACFGRFIDYLQERGRYENSIVVLTSDHGDSLGENGYWGHAMWLFPEDVRVPLMVHVPEALKAGLTTDLARLSFSTDIAPTLYALLGHQLRGDLGPLFGEPLFVPVGRTLSDRRRQAFLLTSSYGATYGLLRRNGRLLYVSDLVEWQESAYDLSTGPLGRPLAVDSGSRRLNQRGIKAQVADVSAFYRFAR